MRAASFARDAYPTPPTRFEGWPPRRVDRPRSWEELDCPDEIELEAGEDGFYSSMRHAGLSVDQTTMLGPDLGRVIVTKQAEDCWYAGVPRGRRLVLRRI